MLEVVCYLDDGLDAPRGYGNTQLFPEACYNSERDEWSSCPWYCAGIPFPLAFTLPTLRSHILLRVRHGGSEGDQEREGYNNVPLVDGVGRADAFDAVAKWKIVGKPPESSNDENTVECF